MDLMDIGLITGLSLIGLTIRDAWRAAIQRWQGDEPVIISGKVDPRPLPREDPPPPDPVPTPMRRVHGRLIYDTAKSELIWTYYRGCGMSGGLYRSTAESWFLADPIDGLRPVTVEKVAEILVREGFDDNRLLELGIALEDA